MKRLLPILMSLILLTSCAGGAADWSSFAPLPEDRLVIYTSHKESVYAPIVKEFEERTGIWVQVETGGTTALLSRLEEESEAPSATSYSAAEWTACKPVKRFSRPTSVLYPIISLRPAAARTAAGQPFPFCRWC